MDFNSLKDQVTNLTLYDLKAGVRKVQNGMYSSDTFDVRLGRNLDANLSGYYSCYELHRDGIQGR